MFNWRFDLQFLRLPSLNLHSMYSMLNAGMGHVACVDGTLNVYNIIVLRGIKPKAVTSDTKSCPTSYYYEAVHMLHCQWIPTSDCGMEEEWNSAAERNEKQVDYHSCERQSLWNLHLHCFRWYTHSWPIRH